MIGWQVKAIAIGIAAIGLLALAAYAKWTHDRLEHWKGRAQVVEATLEAERENTRKANESAKRHQTRANALEADRRDNPLPAVRVCRSPARVPEAGTATVPDATVEANDPPADAGDRDIGPALDEFATDAEANLIQCQELQRWVESR